MSILFCLIVSYVIDWIKQYSSQCCWMVKNFILSSEPLTFHTPFFRLVKSVWMFTAYCVYVDSLTHSLRKYLLKSIPSQVLSKFLLPTHFKERIRILHNFWYLLKNDEGASRVKKKDNTFLGWEYPNFQMDSLLGDFQRKTIWIQILLYLFPSQTSAHSTYLDDFHNYSSRSNQISPLHRS